MLRVEDEQYTSENCVDRHIKNPKYIRFIDTHQPCLKLPTIHYHFTKRCTQLTSHFKEHIIKIPTSIWVALRLTIAKKDQHGTSVLIYQYKFFHIIHLTSQWSTWSSLKIFQYFFVGWWMEISHCILIEYIFSYFLCH